jgi:hypothetical protein
MKSLFEPIPGHGGSKKKEFEKRDWLTTIQAQKHDFHVFFQGGKLSYPSKVFIKIKEKMRD